MPRTLVFSIKVSVSTLIMRGNFLFVSFLTNYKSLLHIGLSIVEADLSSFYLKSAPCQISSVFFLPFVRFAIDTIVITLASRGIFRKRRKIFLKRNAYIGNALGQM